MRRYSTTSLWQHARVAGSDEVLMAALTTRDYLPATLGYSCFDSYD
jgi:hypothetical protein